MKALAVALWLALLFSLSMLILDVSGMAEAQTFAPGAVQSAVPAPGRHFLDQPIATCVIATPVSQNAVMLTPCPPGVPTAPPPVVTAPIAPTAEPKSEPREPTVLRIEVVPVAPAPPAAKPAPKAAPKKKECPC